MLTEKVGCILVTSHLQQFLEDYPPSSDKQAFLDVYHMLSLLDKYLCDNPKQHTHCMSADNEYVTLLKYAIHLNIDLSMFLTLWAVLSIPLDTQDGKHEYVKLLHEEYNTYYANKPRKYMVNLEKKLVEIQNRMHDSVTQNFDRVSDLNDNGLTPLQGQQDEQPECVDIPGNAMDDDVVDIMTLWSLDTSDRCDINEIANDRSRKEIQDELYKDTPVKTEINRPYIDNIDAYNRDRALITKSFTDRLGLGQNSLLGAQQVRVAVKHTNQTSEFPEHLRRISLGEEIENISYEEIDRNRNFIPQVDGTVDSRDRLTESPVKHTSTQRHIEKINEDTSDNDTDEMITFDEEKVKKTYRKDINALRKRVKTVKTKKGRTTKMYTINIERKKLLKQRRKKALQNAKDRKLSKENFLTALKADCKADRASNDTQSSANANDELINGANVDTRIHVDNIDNIEIVAENATNAENIDTDSTNADNIVNAEIENAKSEEFVMSDDNIDNATMSDNNIDDAALGDDNTENVAMGETGTEDIPSPLLYGRKTTDPSKVKISKKHIPIQVKPSEPSIADPPADEIATEMVKGYAFDPTDVRVYEFFIQSTPNAKDLEGVEEDQLLDIQLTVQEKLKERDEERERNITKRMKQYEEKCDFINKALLESVAQITEMTKSDHPTAAARVKSADKIVMLPPLFNGSKPEVAKQHYERFNQYIKFQTKSGNIRDPIAEAIELFEHTLDKKALNWFQEHKDKFVDLTTLKTMFLQRYNPWGKTKRDQLQSWNILIFDPQKTDVDEHIDLINTLGDMLGQTAELKMEKFIDTMLTIIQTHLITCKTWAKTTKKAKE